MNITNKIIWEKICNSVDYIRLSKCLSEIQIKKNSILLRLTLKIIINNCLEKSEISLDSLYERYFQNIFPDHKSFYNYIKNDVNQPYIELLESTKNSLTEKEKIMYAGLISTDQKEIVNQLDLIYNKNKIESRSFKNFILRNLISGNLPPFSTYNSVAQREILAIENEYRTYMNMIPIQFLREYGDTKYDLSLIARISVSLSERIGFQNVNVSDIIFIYNNVFRRGGEFREDVLQNRLNRYIDRVVNNYERERERERAFIDLENLLANMEMKERTERKEQKRVEIKYHLYTSKDEGQCSICFDDFKEGDKISTTQCGHSFHKDCIKTWFIKNPNSCPLCRQKMIPFSFIY